VSIHVAQVSAEAGPEFSVRALVEKMKVDVTQRRRETIRVPPLPVIAVLEAEAESIVAR
jgi:hypothetical protein